MPIILLNMFLQHNLLVSPGPIYYIYYSGCWRVIDERKLPNLLFNEINSIRPKIWLSTYEKEYWANLERRLLYITDMNPNKNMLTLENGSLDLETFELKPYSPEYYSNVKIPVRFGPKAEYTRFMQFLEKIFENHQELITAVQEIIGYLLTAETKAEKVFLFFGTSSNGKSILSKVIFNMVGKWKGLFEPSLSLTLKAQLPELNC